MKHYLHLVLTAIMLLCFGGVVDAQTEFDFSKDLPSTWEKVSGTVQKQTYKNVSCCQLLKGATIKSPKLGKAYNHIKLNLSRSSNGTTLEISATVGSETINLKTYTSSDVVSGKWNDYEFDLPESVQSEDCYLTIKAAASSYYISKITLTGTSTDPSKTPTTLSFGEEYDGKTITKYIGDENVYSIPATLSPSIEGAKITYKSSNPDLVYIDENNGDIMVAGTELGTATITASYAGNDTYASSSASYTVNVKKPTVVEDGVFDFTSGELDYGSGLTPRKDYTDYDESTTWQNGIVTISTKGNTRWWENTDNDELRFYSGSSFTVNVPSGNHITNVAITGGYSFKADCGTYNTNSGKWTGNANAITFTYNAKGKIAVKTITVTYVPDATLTTAASSFATYSCDYAVDYSAAGLKAYAVKLDEANNKVVYTEINGTVAAATPVLLQGEASTQYTLAPSTAKATTVDTDLQMSDGSVVAADNLYYGFATVNGISGFKLVQNGITIPAKKGYLKLSAASSDAKAFYAFNGETTGINETLGENNFDENAPRYNVSGQRVDKSFKGLVIINGKKYILK